MGATRGSSGFGITREQGSVLGSGFELQGTRHNCRLLSDGGAAVMSNSTRSDRVVKEQRNAAGRPHGLHRQPVSGRLRNPKVNQR